MIIEIVGKPRAGKTALNTLFMFRELMYNGFLLQRQSRQIISGYNENRELKLGYSKKPPIYSNYEAKILRPTLQIKYRTFCHAVACTSQRAENIGTDAKVLQCRIMSVSFSKPTVIIS